MKIRYKNYTLRSKTEFAWALHFDRLKVDWGYETVTFREGRASYTPDFSLYEGALFIEIKVWGAARINQIHLCNYPLLLIFGLPERHYVRVKPMEAACVLPGHCTSWQDALQKVVPHDVLA